MMSSYDATPMWEATYLPYGQEWNGPSGSGPVSPNHYKFTGKERDPESGLDYFGARFHTSLLARFLSPDPEGVGARELDPQSWNGYAYAGNNPLNAVDPDGEDYYLIAGDECGKKVDCDKSGLVLDKDGKRVVITDEQIRDGAVKAEFNDEGNLVFTTEQGKFTGLFFDQGKTHPDVEVTALSPNLEALVTAGKLAEPGINAAMVITAPNFAAAGIAAVSLAGPTLPEFTFHGAIRTAQRAISQMQAQSTVMNATQTYRATNGMRVFVQQIGTKFRVVIKGERIHTALEVSAKTLAKMARSGGWK